MLQMVGKKISSANKALKALRKNGHKIKQVTVKREGNGTLSFAVN